MARAARLEILGTDDDSRWRETLEETGRHDFCHLVEYSRLAERSGHGRAELLVWRDGDQLLAFPVLFRSIDIELYPKVDGVWSDMSSVYGYAGPIAKPPQVSEEVSRECMAALDEYLRARHIVSAFCRMHPLLEQRSIFDECGEVVPVGRTLSLDLTQPEEAQRAAYRRNHRQDIRRLEKMGVECSEVGLDAVNHFVEMYWENMDRVRAARRYYFSRAYFECLLTDMKEVVHLFMCHHEGRPISGSIFTNCCGIVQWWLSGSRSDFDGPPPAKLLFDYARRWAVEQGASVLHLGGGVGGNQDSLYHFKRGFTKREHVYLNWRHIVNEEVYADLVRSRAEATGVTPDESFFPLYRHPAFECLTPAASPDEGASAKREGE
ncbi:MAG: GNAT family N-acetyltransferase [Armatimonadetes bacterium]|nr:GNAT family N-acetyltransferase [Armatimonadota bacterium]